MRNRNEAGAPEAGSRRRTIEVLADTSLLEYVAFTLSTTDAGRDRWLVMRQDLRVSYCLEARAAFQKWRAPHSQIPLIEYVAAEADGHDVAQWRRLPYDTRCACLTSARNEYLGWVVIERDAEFERRSRAARVRIIQPAD